MRMLCLTLLISVYNVPDVVEMVHIPLGITGVTFSGLAGWLLLRYMPDIQASRSQPAFVTSGYWIAGM